MTAPGDYYAARSECLVCGAITHHSAQLAPLPRCVPCAFRHDTAQRSLLRRALRWLVTGMKP